MPDASPIIQATEVTEENNKLVPAVDDFPAANDEVGLRIDKLLNRTSVLKAYNELRTAGLNPTATKIAEQSGLSRRTVTIHLREMLAAAGVELNEAFFSDVRNANVKAVIDALLTRANAGDTAAIKVIRRVD